MNRKTITFMLCLCLVGFEYLCQAQNGYEKIKITKEIKNEPLENVLIKLADESGIKIIFSNSEIKGVMISAQLKDSDIDECFTKILKESGFAYKHLPDKNTVIITKLKKSGTIKSYTISGFIEDSESLERLIGATVYEKKTLKGTACNNYGFYSLTLPPGIHSITYSFVGCTAKEMVIDLKEDIFLNVKLEFGQQIGEVVVSAKQIYSRQDVSQMSMNEISMNNVKSLPVLLGEVDMIKTIQLLPGIQSGNEGSSGLYVRGGGPDQNLVLLDGVPVYNSSHLFGFFSVFNADAITDTKVYKGGFPARYGGRLSSVIDVHMKEGNLKKYHGAATVGLISSKLSIEGPIVKDKTSFIVSGRRTFADLLKKLISKDGSMLYFYDINFKINHKFSDKDRLYASFYSGKDQVKNTTSLASIEVVVPYLSAMEIGWGNSIAALRWNHIYSPKLFSNTTLTYSKFDYKVENKLNAAIVGEKQESNIRYVAAYLAKFQSGIEDWTAKTDFDWIPSNSHYIKMGLGGILHTFTPSVNTYDIENPESSGLETKIHKEKVNEFFAYAEDDISIAGFVKMNIGLHYSTFFIKNKSYQSIQPRGSINVKPSKYTAVKLSYSAMSQYLHLLSNSNVGIPIDLWVPSTEIIKPERSNQYAIGFDQRIGMFSYKIEGYYKSMVNLIEYKDNESIFGKGSKWDQKIETGVGDSYGVEFFVEKTKGKTTGWIGYTLSKTNRKFNNLNNGEVFPFKYDRRHDINIVVMHKFSDKIDVGGTWIFGTGYAYSLAISKYLEQDFNVQNPMYSTPNYINDNSKRNNMRIPDYHRLDLSANYHIKKKKTKSTFSLSIYNVYNRMNPFAYQIDTQNSKLRQISIFPVLPTVSYKIDF